MAGGAVGDAGAVYHGGRGTGKSRGRVARHGSELCARITQRTAQDTDRHHQAAPPTTPRTRGSPRSAAEKPGAARRAGRARWAGRQAARGEGEGRARARGTGRGARRAFQRKHARSTGRGGKAHPGEKEEEVGEAADWGGSGGRGGEEGGWQAGPRGRGGEDREGREEGKGEGAPRRLHPSLLCWRCPEIFFFLGPPAQFVGSTHTNC